MKIIYLLIGCPATGKSWVCNQLTDLYNYIPHDNYLGKSEQYHLDTIEQSANASDKPTLIDTPLFISKFKVNLEAKGFKVIPVFINEDPFVIAQRYLQREHKPIPKGHLTRQRTFIQRAKEWGAFIGTSTEVLEYLRKQVS